LFAYFFSVTGGTLTLTMTQTATLSPPASSSSSSSSSATPVDSAETRGVQTALGAFVRFLLVVSALAAAQTLLVVWALVLWLVPPYSGMRLFELIFIYRLPNNSQSLKEMIHVCPQTKFGSTISGFFHCFSRRLECKYQCCFTLTMHV
jgi:hypothetical protein